MATARPIAVTSEENLASTSVLIWQHVDGRAVSWSNSDHGTWFIRTTGTKRTLHLLGRKLESNPVEHGSPPQLSAVR